jgi:hypothetical protein
MLEELREALTGDGRDERASARKAAWYALDQVAPAPGRAVAPPSGWSDRNA